MKNKKLIAKLPKGWVDRRGSTLALKKKIIKIIEDNFINFGFSALETPFAEISENIGSFLAEDQTNPMSDVFSFQDGNERLTILYDLSSSLARFVAERYRDLPSIYKRYQIASVARNEKFDKKKIKLKSFSQADADIVGAVNKNQANAENNHPYCTHRRVTWQMDHVAIYLEFPSPPQSSLMIERLP